MPEIEVRIVDKNQVLLGILAAAELGDLSLVLNDIGDGEVSYNPASAGSSQLALVKTRIQAWRDGTLVWVGIPKSRKGNSAGVTVSMETPEEVFRDRYVLEENLEYIDIDQLTIANNLVNYAQSAAQGTNADENIDIGAFAASGVLRTRTYISDRKHPIYEALKEFSTLEDGFDWAVIFTADGQLKWQPYFPFRGGLKDLLLEYGGSVVDYTYEEDATKLATKVDATGGTAQVDVWNPFEGREKQYYIHEDVAASANTGVRVAVLPSGSRSDMAWLEARAKRAVAIRKNPLIITSVRCRQGDGYPTLSGWLYPGDTVRVRIDHGSIQVNDTYRIRTVTWHPSSDEVSLEFTSVVDA